MSTVQTTTLVEEVLAPTRIQTHGKETDQEDNEIEIIDNLWVIPTFEDKYEERQWAKEHMAGAFRVFAKFGYTDGSGGHISLRDPVRPDCFWISMFAIPRGHHLCTY